METEIDLLVNDQKRLKSESASLEEKLCKTKTDAETLANARTTLEDNSKLVQENLEKLKESVNEK